jgi:hypothetical protein
VVIWPKAIVREKDIIKPVRRLPKGGLAIQEHSPSPLFKFFKRSFSFSSSFTVMPCFVFVTKGYVS